MKTIALMLCGLFIGFAGVAHAGFIDEELDALKSGCNVSDRGANADSHSER